MSKRPNVPATDLAPAWSHVGNTDGWKSSNITPGNSDSLPLATDMSEVVKLGGNRNSVGYRFSYKSAQNPGYGITARGVVIPQDGEDIFFINNARNQTTNKNATVITRNKLVDDLTNPNWGGPEAQVVGVIALGGARIISSLQSNNPNRQAVFGVANLGDQISIRNLGQLSLSVFTAEKGLVNNQRPQNAYSEEAAEFTAFVPYGHRDEEVWTGNKSVVRQALEDL